MSELNRLLEDALFAREDKAPRAQASEPRLDGLLRVVTARNEREQVPTRRSPPQDWDTLIHRVQSAARQSREVEAQAREREERIEHVLQRVREDIQASNERVRVAEAHARDADVRAEARVMAAEERARAAEARAEAAEARAQHAEGWLIRVQETITSEFAGLTDHAA